MFGWNRPRRPHLVAFDVIGTVFPLHALRPSVMALGLPRAGLETWYATATRDALALTAAGGFVPFATVMEAALDVVLAEQSLSPPRAARRALMRQFAHLPARPDARIALELVRRAEMQTMMLSNGAASSTAALLRQAGLERLVDHVVSVEAVKLFKPRPEVYRHAARVGRVRPRRMALVAAHPWDTNGAAAAGLVTGFLSADRPYTATMRRPDVAGATLTDVVRALAAL